MISCKEVSLFGLLTNVFRELDVVQETESCSKYPKLKNYTDKIEPGSSWVSDLLSQSLLCCCLTNLCCNLVSNLKSPDTAKLSSWSQSLRNKLRMQNIAHVTSYGQVEFPIKRKSNFMSVVLVPVEIEV